MDNNAWYRLPTKDAVNSFGVKKNCMMSYTYNGGGVQANEYSALAGGLDMVILRTSVTNSKVLWGGGGVGRKEENLPERLNMHFAGGDGWGGDLSNNPSKKKK